MTAVTAERPPARSNTAAPSPIPFARILGVELTKIFDTRSGFWLTAGIGISAVLATAAVILFAPNDDLTYDSFGAAIGMPMVVLLPIMAILLVTSEWSQRSGLTTFTLVPHRSRVIMAKMTVAVLVGAVSIVVALGIGAVGNVLGSAIAGVDTVWDISTNQVFSLVLANVLGLLVGFMLGVLIRNSAGAIVAYFVYGFVLAGLTALLADSQQWFRDLQPWVDFNYAQSALFEGSLTGEQWANLGVAGVLWLVIPLAVGLVLIRRSEVK
ncbi:MAG: ABC transporter permease [Actinomycetota bacterium]|nr:ABC transporter permease [Actinomycetota bacterium]